MKCIMMNGIKRNIYSGITAVILLCGMFCMLANSSANAQSKKFKLTQGLDVQYNILQALATDYVDTVDFGKMINIGIDAMLSSLDPYTEYLPEENNEAIDMMTTATYGGVGAVIKKIDSLGVMIMQPSEGSPAVKSGLEPGDIILTIDGVDVKPLTADECSKRMRGNAGTQVKFKVRKGATGELKDIVVTREKIHTSDVPYMGLLKDSTGALTTDGYIKISGFTLNGAEDVKKAVIGLKEKGAKRLILDLRSNGGGLMDEAVNIVSLFVPKGTLVVYAKGRGEGTNFSYKTTKEPVDTLIPLMVLVNSSSASSSEIVAGALQDLDRATIIGTRTYGKGLVQSFRPVGYNGRIKLTISKYYTPSGRCVQAMDYTHRNEDGSVGAVPDSLKKPFKTKAGRIVYDGGGITPDIEVKGETNSRPAYALYSAGLLDDWAVEYFMKHKTIAPADKFKLGDGEYEEFVKFAADKNFDQRSSAEVIFDRLLNEAKSDGMYEDSKEQYDNLAKKLKLSKEEMLRLKRDEIKLLLEENIVQKYYYIKGRMECSIRSDIQLHEAVAKWK
ncbi:MAG: S41 family peptidase [Candidatus Egerieousia sp.]